MAPTEDQRAMLQLLLDGGQSYDDIASLLGISRDEVRKRARDALREIGGADPDAEVGLTDYLLGQADPIGRADAARHLQSSPQANELARKVAAQLRLLAPSASLPEIPAARGGVPAATPPKAEAPARVGPGGAAAEPASATAGAEAGRRVPGLAGIGERFKGLSRRGSQLRVLIGAGALLLVAVVLVATGAFGGGDESSSSNDETQTSAANEDLTIVKLDPVGGSGASGQAVFARAGDQPVLQINLTGLKPTSGDENYIVWLYASDQIAFPLARDRVGEDGNLTGAAPIPQQLIGVLGQFQSINVSLASNKETRDAIKQATDAQSFPAFVGESVLRGDIPSGANASGGGGTQGAPTTPAPGTGGGSTGGGASNGGASNGGAGY